MAEETPRESKGAGLSKLRDRIRVQQSGPRLTPQQVFEALQKHFGAHDDHHLEQVGRCIYCTDCNVRVCQGQLSEEYKKAHPPKPKPRKETSADRMRERWNK